MLVVLRVLDYPTDALKAFGLASSTTSKQLLVYLNFALMDCAFAVLAKNFPKPSEAKLMKTIFIGNFIDELDKAQSGGQ